ncbi:hemolysin family protein [Aeromicrobium sp. IC_218]|uniref:hemolysin family protein n=1 Tax=Aeromicrobium sp. IC_218 TaxID=2545468 RepID=UPI00103E7421|nr:hemolysin family protein [Aeromicrobium sp. IC_218]TCI96932.1 HlyC/CorC family transporter [Aeromicrobium sp. IC_218]
MDQQTWLNAALVLVFVLVGGVFAATELALVSLRESQLNRLESESARGAKVAKVARDPNRFLAAVQIGVTVAGFLSAAYGASTLAPDFAPFLVDLGVPSGAADPLMLVLMTLIIAYLSLVLGELVPKRFALQKSQTIALVVTPALDRFAQVMRPVIWLLSVSTNAVVRLLGGDPNAKVEEISDEEVRDIVSGHGGFGVEQRAILEDVLEATNRSVKEAMRPRGEVAFLKATMTLNAAAQAVREQPYSRYPVMGEGVDDVRGYLHVRDLFDQLHDAPGDTRVRVGDLARQIVVLPGTNRVLPSVNLMRSEGTHIAVVVDEYGGTDGIVTLEDLVEELVGDIRDEYDLRAPVEVLGEGPRTVEGGLTIEEFAERTGVELEDGSYETVAGYVITHLGRMPEVGDHVDVGGYRLTVAALDKRRVTEIQVALLEPEDEPAPAE